MMFRTLYRVAFLVVTCFALASAQTPAPSPKNPAPPAPQVVTIIHRLNGLKMFRLLLRSDEVQPIDALDSAFSLRDDVHTNVSAGLAMDDGETIAAWLPEAEVELDAALPPAPPSPRAPKPPRTPVAAFPRLQNGFFQPDITVIGPEGQRVGAKYIGFNGAPGLPP